MKTTESTDSPGYPSVDVLYPDENIKLVTYNTYFISGHLDLTQEEFDQHYVPLLDKVIKEEPMATFVFAEAKGADTMALLYLQARITPDRIIVFHMFGSPRNQNLHQLCIIYAGGYKSDVERDKALTLHSTHDIAWVKPGREKKSGTAKNLKRRSEIKQSTKFLEYMKNSPNMAADAIYDLKREKEELFSLLHELLTLKQEWSKDFLGNQTVHLILSEKRYNEIMNQLYG